MSLEQAALAFDAAMGARAPSAPAGNKEESEAPPERHFLREMEDDTSGGDEDDLEQPQTEDEPGGDGEDNGGDRDTEDGDPEADTDADEDGKDDESNPEAGDVDLETKVEVTVDGKPVIVPLKEALDGYIRTETFHQRMTHLNDVQVAMKNEAITLLQQRTKATELLTDLETQMKGLLPPKPDWDRLYAEDPAAARRLQKDYEVFEGKIKELQETRSKVTKEAAEQTARETAQFAQTEFTKFVTTNKLGDEKVLAKELGSMRRTALEAGFAEEEINTVYDSRMLTILRKASKYDRMMAARPQPNKGQQQGRTSGDGTPRVIIPKGTVGRGNVRTSDRAEQQLRRTGSIDAAASVFHNIIKRS